MRHVVPILNVRDVAASLAYYVDVLGFGHSWAWGDPPTFGGVVTGHAEIQFCQDGQGNAGTWFSVWVEDVDELYERLRSRDVDIRQPPTTTFSGACASSTSPTRTATGSASAPGPGSSPTAPIS